MRPRTSQIVFAAFAVVLVAACNSGSNEAPVPSLPVTNGDVLEAPYASVAELFDTSDLVVTGEVVGRDSIGTPDSADDPHASEYFVVSVKPTRVLKGEAPAVVAIAWEGFVTNGRGERTLEIRWDGVAMPNIGEELLLFLVPESSEREAFFGSPLTHKLNTLDGVLLIDADGHLTSTLDGDSRPAHQMVGLQVEDVVALAQGG